MNPIASAIITALSAVSTQKQNEAQTKLEAYRQSYETQKEQEQHNRNKELILLKNKSSSGSSSKKTKDYKQEILVSQHKINNELSNSENAFKKYPSLANIGGNNKDKATLLYAIQSNENVPYMTLQRAKKVYRLLEQDPNFNNMETINAWNNLALVEPELMEQIYISPSNNEPEAIISTETLPKEENSNPIVRYKPKWNWFNPFKKTDSKVSAEEKANRDLQTKSQLNNTDTTITLESILQKGKK